MASLGAMVAAIAHEINTPLGICLTSISHIKEQTDLLFEAYNEKRLKHADFKKFTTNLSMGVDLSLSNITRAAELISSFKQVAVDQSSENLHLFKVREAIENSVKIVSPRLKKQKVAVSISGNEELEISSYPGIFSQIIINLLINTVTHGLKEQTIPEITIEFYQSNEQITLIYRDNGCGISAENQKLIFEPFFTTNRSQGNTGLGMHIVYNLVTQKLKGQITLTSPDIGVEFIISIPLFVTDETKKIK